MAKALQQHVQALAHLAKVTPGDWLIGWSGFGTQNPDDPKQDAASGDSNRWLICKFAKRLGSPIFNSHHLPFSAFDAHARTRIACSAHALYTQATCKRPAGKSKRGAWNEDSCLAVQSGFPKDFVVPEVGKHLEAIWRRHGEGQSRAIVLLTRFNLNPVKPSSRPPR